MNLPNKLTVLRICLVPVMLIFLLVPGIPFRFLIADLIFSAASITDMLDGKIARKNNLVTDFGKFADPLADKVLVFSALLALMTQGMGSALVVIVLLAREFMVMAVRLSAAAGGKVVAASFWAKAKTVSQMVALIAIMVLAQLQPIAANFGCTFFTMDFVSGCSEVMLWITALFSVVSGVQYVKTNWEFISQAK